MRICEAIVCAPCEGRDVSTGPGDGGSGRPFAVLIGRGIDAKIACRTRDAMIRRGAGRVAMEPNMIGAYGPGRRRWRARVRPGSRSAARASGGGPRRLAGDGAGEAGGMPALARDRRGPRGRAPASGRLRRPAHRAPELAIALRPADRGPLPQAEGGRGPLARRPRAARPRRQQVLRHPQDRPDGRRPRTR